MIKITSIPEFIKSLHIFRKYGEVTLHWMINQKAKLKWMLQFGFVMEYKHGYIFWKKTFTEFN